MNKGSLPLSAGWWGKLPSRGDFVGHGIPRRARETWDDWLQSTLVEAAQSLGAQALRDRLRLMPAWRLIVLPAMERHPLYCGALLPSHDRVGRAFPLVLAEGWDTRALAAIEVAALHARAGLIADLRAAETPTPEELDSRVAALAATPLEPCRGATGPGRRTVAEWRLEARSALSLWWHDRDDDDAPHADRWPPAPGFWPLLLGM